MDEFLKILEENKLPIEEEAARRLFQLCDRDGSGSIDRDETDGLFQMLKTVMPDVNLEREEEEEAVFEAAAAEQHKKSGKVRESTITRAATTILDIEAAAAEKKMSGKSTLTPTDTASVQIRVHDV